jgi:hypothetical protein
MTKKVMNVLESCCLDIKECMKGHVEQIGILTSECQLDTYRSPSMYLACIAVDRADVPRLEEGYGTEDNGWK